MAALAHPLRVSIMVALGEAPSQNAKELAARIGAPVRSVRHQLSRLAGAGLIEVSGARRRRGVVEKLYSIPFGRVLEVGDEELMGPEESRRVAAQLLFAIAVDVTRALGAGGFGGSGSGEAWIALEVDEAGWAEIAAIARATYEEVEAARSRAESRLARGAAQVVHGASALLCFERPGTGDQGGRPASPAPAAGGLRKAALGVVADSGGVPPAPRPPAATLAAAMGHPLRMRILAALSATEPVAVARLARHLGEPPRRVRHQLAHLLAEGLVTRSPGSGRTRHLYALAATPVLDEGDLARLGPGRTRGAWAEVFRCLVNDAVAAISAGSFYRRPDFCQVRVPATLDARGRAEVQAASRAAVGRIEAAGAAAAARPARRGEASIAVTAAVLWFELPGPDPPRRRAGEGD